MSNKVSNTLYGNKQLFIDGQLKNVDNMAIDELVCNFKSLYVLTLTDEFFDNEYFDNISIFEPILSEKKLENYYKNVCLIKASFSILNNDIMKNSICIISKEAINDLEHKPRDEYNEYTLVVPIFTICKSDIKLYLSQFKNNLLEDYFKIKFMNYYFSNIKKNKDISYMISNCEESNYWIYDYNCKLNISLPFMNRNFNFFDLTNIKDKKLLETIENIKNLPDDGGDYLSHMFRKQNFVDASNSIKKNGYLIYKLHDKKDIPNFYEVILKLHQESALDELILLLSNMLISKDYCHLVLNNENILDIFIKLAPIIYSEHQTRKIIAYGWISLYLEETIKRSYIDINDRFVFNCNIASKLPVFNFNLNKLKDNPYFPLLINDKLYVDLNAYGVDVYNFTNYSNAQNIDRELLKEKYGVVDLNTFKKRMNVFLSGNKNFDIFKHANFKNIAISGSIIAACLPSFNPLIFNTNGNFEAFVDEYYNEADLDIMCNQMDKFEYIDTAFELNEALDKATKELSIENISRINSVKTACIFINLNKVNEIINMLKLNCTKDTFNDKIDENKNKIYNLYVEQKINEHRKYFEEDIEKFKDPKYNSFFEILPIDSVKIYTRNFNELDDNLIPESVMISENLKFKYNVTGIKRSFEIFQIKYSNFFSTVHKFHLPCVRAYYDNTNVFILPSCITACMTLTNIEYKYFAGTKDPIEVINKYRRRGFTTILNDKERIKMIKYSHDIEKWRDLYEIKTLSKNNTDKLFKPLDLNNKLFKPAKNISHPGLYFNKTLYNVYHTSIINEYGYINQLNKNELFMSYKNIKN
uniref:Uncharacterized protein n=1 Tax=viral metagenome TaxID=1070528 RepID=A0A6C0H245_9ZZZZ